MFINVKITRQENAQYFNCAIGDIISVDFEEYIAAVVASEIGNSNIEACKAQAVAARTFAISRGVLKDISISDSSTSAQAYRAYRYNLSLYPNPIQATKETQGQILCYKGKPISAVYSACNGGKTTSSQERWGSAREYLIEQNDPWDAATGKEKKGHGIGLSQAGAVWAGAHNINYKKILSFYYPHTELYADYGKEKLPAKNYLQKLLLLKELITNMQKKIEDKLS